MNTDLDRNRAPSQRDFAGAVFVDEIAEIHGASRRIYGALRVHGQLRHRGHGVSRKREVTVPGELACISTPKSMRISVGKTGSTRR